MADQEQTPDTSDVPQSPAGPQQNEDQAVPAAPREPDPVPSTRQDAAPVELRHASGIEGAASQQPLAAELAQDPEVRAVRDRSHARATPGDDERVVR